MKSLAAKISAGRYPTPRLEIIEVTNSPRDRLVFSRLSPDHMQFINSTQPLSCTAFSEALLNDLKLIESLSDHNNAKEKKEEEYESLWSIVLALYGLEDYQALLRSCPFTDQSYFSQYARLHAPHRLFQADDDIDTVVKSEGVAGIPPSSTSGTPLRVGGPPMTPTAPLTPPHSAVVDDNEALNV